MKTFNVSQVVVGTFSIALAIGAVQKSSVASSVADDQSAANQLVATIAAPAAATQTGGIIANAVGSAIGGAVGGAVGGSVGGAVGGGVAPAPTVTPSASLFDRYGLAAVHEGTSGGVKSYKQDKIGLLKGKLNQIPQFNSRNLKGSAAQGRAPRAGVWIQGAYTTIDNDETGGQFDGNVVNIVAGIDTKPANMKNRMVIGLAVAYENVDIDTTFNSGTFEGDGFTLSPYVGYILTPNLSVDMAVGYSAIDYETSRTSGAVTSEFDADRLFGAVNLTGNFSSKSGKIRITPKVGLLGLYEEQDANTGSDGVTNPEVGIRLGRLSFGVEAGFKSGQGVEPFVSARGEYDFNKNAPVLLTTNQVAQDDDFGVTYGVGVNIRRGQVTGTIRGETNQHKNEIETYSIMGRIRLDF